MTYGAAVRISGLRNGMFDSYRSNEVNTRSIRLGENSHGKIPNELMEAEGKLVYLQGKMKCTRRAENTFDRR